VPNEDSTGVRRLNQAGTVLVAKLSLGALALNDIWFAGQSMNPRLPLDDWSGSSAGPASATATGLIAFAMGGETHGSLISRCVLCGTSGLHPTCCRVPGTGAMTLCWTMGKLGPIAR
jgi:Asp-tRNA(Asn)/Glu-tRNA(Gln) amidotransferase A subunit family amidase